MRSLSRQTAVLDIFKSPSGTRASPPVLLDTEGDEPDDPHTVKEEVSFLKLSFACHFVFFVIFRN
jgi:hypothetical protein